MVPIVPGTVGAPVEVDSGAPDDETLGIGISLPVGPAVGTVLGVPVVGKLLAGGGGGRPNMEDDSPGPVGAGEDDSTGNGVVPPTPVVPGMLPVGAVTGKVLDAVSLGPPAVEFENDG
jgi:hypothetical protein